MEQNPYESPRVPEPVMRSTVARRSIGAATILVLTPLAVLIAFGGSCAATFAFLNTNLFGQNYGAVFFVGWSIFLIPPAAVLIGMVWWFRATSRAKASEQNNPPARKSP